MSQPPHTDPERSPEPGYSGPAGTGILDELDQRVIKILQHRGRLVARALDEASSVKRLVQAGLIRAVERPGSEVILVLSGDGLRLAHRTH